MRPSRAEPSQSRSARQLPQRGSPWQIGSLPTGRLRPDMAQKSGPRLRGQRLLDDMICQAAVALGSRALQLIKQKAFLSQQKPCRHARGSPKGATATTAASGGNRESLLGPRPAGCEARTKGRSRCWEPQPGQWHGGAVTERFDHKKTAEKSGFLALLRFPVSNGSIKSVI